MPPKGFNYVHLLIILLFVSATVVQWVFRKVQEQAALKRAKNERERRVTEALRTGRTPAPEPVVAQRVGVPLSGPVSHADARKRLQELAERRQRQLEELRRAGQGAPGPGAS